jgi:hypothetical protein
MSRISRTAVDGSLKVARLPLDMAITFLPAGRRSAKLALDRADASVRSLAASVLGDDALGEDADRRHAATEARERANELKGEAGEVAQRADDRVAERQHQAATRRRGADSRARSRQQQAAKRQVQRTKQAAQTGRVRREASREVEAQVEQAIEDAAPEARLEALNGVAQAQQERDQALAQMDEAQRLRKAAERVKEERKEG